MAKVAPKTAEQPTSQPQTKAYDSIAAIFCKAPDGILPPLAPCRHGKAVRKWKSLSVETFNEWCKDNVVGAKLRITFEWAGKVGAKVGKETIHIGVKPVIQYAKVASSPSDCSSDHSQEDSRKRPFKVVGYVNTKGWTSELGCNVVFPLAADKMLSRVKHGDRFTAHANVTAASMHRLTRRGKSSLVLQLTLDDAPVDKDSLDKVLSTYRLATDTRPKPEATSRPTTKPSPRRKRTDEDKARSQFNMARNYINAGMKAKGENLLKKLIAKYPKTKAAARAAVELEDLKAD